MGYNLSLDILWGEKRCCPSVHSIVAEYFIGPRPTGYQINHKDRNKGNNHVSNLEYVTPQENVRHAMISGARKGDLSAENLTSIRRDKEQGLNKKDIQIKYSLSQGVVDGVYGGRTYAAITGIPRATKPKGELVHFAKLTKEEVIKIKQILVTGGILHKDIANQFNVSSVTISDIKCGRSWKHV